MAARRTETTLSEDFLEEEITLRGTLYKFRELSGSKYEELIKLAEGPDGTADLATVLRLMIPEAMVSPKMTTEQIYSKPLPIVTAMQNVVNRMNFRAEETAADDAKEEAGDEEEVKNGSEPQTS